MSYTNAEYCVFMITRYNFEIEDSWKSILIIIVVLRENLKIKEKVSLPSDRKENFVDE